MPSSPKRFGTKYLVYPDGKTYLLHRVVASLFLENPENLTDVNHKDGDRSNNNVSNLEWISKSDNQKHAYSVLNRKRSSKLSDAQVLEVFNLRNNDNLPLKEIAARFGINFRTVSEISKGKRFCLHKEENACA